MKRVLLALYTALLLCANPALADVGAAEAARAGDMKKLNFHSEPKPAGTSAIETLEGEPAALSDYEGKWTLVNFWATWCAPCRKEMPMLSELQAEMGSDAFEVITVATTRNPRPAIHEFFDEIGVENLPRLVDDGSALSREMGVLGLPVTVILNPEGQEVARMQGDADWASEDARALIEALVAPAG